MLPVHRCSLGYHLHLNITAVSVQRATETSEEVVTSPYMQPTVPRNAEDAAVAICCHKGLKVFFPSSSCHNEKGEGLGSGSINAPGDGRSIKRDPLLVQVEILYAKLDPADYHSWQRLRALLPCCHVSSSSHTVRFAMSTPCQDLWSLEVYNRQYLP